MLVLAWGCCVIDESAFRRLGVLNRAAALPVKHAGSRLIERTDGSRNVIDGCGGKDVESLGRVGDEDGIEDEIFGSEFRERHAIRRRSLLYLSDLKPTWPTLTGSAAGLALAIQWRVFLAWRAC